MTHPDDPRFAPDPMPSRADDRQAPPRRAFAPDLARGFMLGIIALANVTAYLWGSSATSTASSHPVSGSALDTTLSTLTILFVDGRIYPMFAFLFGYGIVQFSRHRSAAGDEPDTITRMILRRNLWLVVFGLVHAVLLFAGDILGAYGLAGLILGYALLRGSDRGLWLSVWVMAALFTFLALFQAAVGLLAVMLAEGTSEGDFAAEADQPEFLRAITDSFVTLGNGDANYFLAMVFRIIVWLVTTVLANVTLIVPLCIVLGGLAARHWWIEARPGPPRRPRLGLTAAIGIPVGVIGALPQAVSYLGRVPEAVFPSATLLGLNQITGVFAGLGYAALFGLIGIRFQNRPPRLLLPVAYLGKRSLSFYLLQSVIFAPLLAAWGFGLGRTWNTTPAFLLAIGVWVLSLGLATWLESRNSKGPAEVVLRRLTYGPSRPR